MSKEEFNPKILGFLCNWCCYAAADAAGVSRYQYPPNLRTIRVMCTGRIDPVFILRGLQEGAAGIFTGGWQLGECHYQVGNYDAMGMFSLVRKVLTEVGIKPERFSLQWASAAEAPRFVKLITEFTRQIKELGPPGEAEGIAPEEMRERIAKGLAAVSSRKVRMVFGNTTKTIRKEGIFTQEHITSVIEDKMAKSLGSVFAGSDEDKETPADKTAEAPAVTEEKPAGEKKPAAKKAAPAKTPDKKKAAPPKATAAKTKKKPAAKKK